MKHTNKLIKQYFNISGQELLVDKIPVSAIADKYGTPLFVYVRKILDQKWRLIRGTFPINFSIYYSMKANPHPVFLKYFLKRNCGLEVASGGEFYTARKAGCSPEKIVFAGPGKTEAELELALIRGIGEIHVESMKELGRINNICNRAGLTGKVALRINPSKNAIGGALHMGGKSTPFGIDEEYLDTAIDQIMENSSVEFCGAHFFVGTQILDHTNMLNQYRHGIMLARRIAKRFKQPLQTIDFGGGLGIPYFAHEKELDMHTFGKGLKILMTEIKNDPLFEGTNFIIEPGRFLVGEAGVYLMRINDIKVSRGKKYLIADGGMHHHLAASGNLGQTIKRNFPLAILNKLNSSQIEEVDVVGPLCTPLDVLGRTVKLPKAEIGDLIGVFQSGAYARSASPLAFLSHPAPPEVWVENGEDRLIRRRGRIEDLFVDLPDLSQKKMGQR